MLLATAISFQKRRVRRRLLILLMVTPSLHAQENLDTLIQGFDEADKTHVIDGLLDGFNDNATPEASGVDALIDGFDDNKSMYKSDSPSQSIPSPFTLSGSFSIKGEYAYTHKAPATGETDFRGFNSLKNRLGLKLDYDFNPQWRAHVDASGVYDLIYTLRDNKYSQALVDSDERYGEIGEAWIRGTINPHVDIKIGRQIVVWGKSDSLRVTDVINPLDNRTPGMADIEDIRLPLTMARIDYYTGDWGIKFMLIPEYRTMRLPGDGSEFDPFPTALPPNTSPDKSEFAIAANGRFSGWDLSLYYADLYDDMPHIANAGSMNTVRDYSRYKMTGIAANVVEGSWLLKGEAAYFDGIRYSGVINPDQQRTDLLAGVEYSCIENANLSLEFSQSTINSYNTTLALAGIEQTNRQMAIRFTQDLLHNQLHLIAMSMQGDWNFSSGGFSRLSGQYDLSDGLNITTGLVIFHSGRLFPIGSYGDNDRLFIEAKYSF